MAESTTEHESDTARRLVAELFGTSALVVVAAGGETIGSLTGAVSPAARAVAPGLLVMALIYAIGNASGAHFNPAVTFAFALRRAFPWEAVPAYWVAQVAGAVLGAGLLRLAFPDAPDLGVNRPHVGVGSVLILEVFLTCLLVAVALGTATRYQLFGPNAAIAVGGTIALAGLIAAPAGAASMNPARSLGPAVVAGETRHLWVYFLGPFLGALAAVLLTAVIHPHKHTCEREAAGGDGPPPGETDRGAGVAPSLPEEPAVQGRSPKGRGHDRSPRTAPRH
jgi:MIP family channel proteins